MNSQELNQKADAVLRIMLSKDDKKAPVRSDDHSIMYDNSLRDYAIEIFKYIEGKSPSFIKIYEYSSFDRFKPPPLGATIKQQWLSRVEPFLNAGGYQRFNEFTDYEQELIKAPLFDVGRGAGYLSGTYEPIANITHINNHQTFNAPVTHSNIIQSGERTDNTDFTTNPITYPMNMQMNTPFPDKRMGALQKLANWVINNIVPVIIGVISSLIAAYIAYKFGLFSPHSS